MVKIQIIPLANCLFGRLADARRLRSCSNTLFEAFKYIKLYFENDELNLAF